jgi:cystathionine gamma-synthase/methionine-gamma-lyase
MSAPSQKLRTRLVHSAERAEPPRGRPTATPIFTSATYVFERAADLDAAFASGEDFVYARYGNPTVAHLERALADVEGGAGAVAFATGMAALHAAILTAGTPRGATQPQVRGVLASRDLYGATTGLLEDFFAAQGVPVRYTDFCDLEQVSAALAELKPSVVLAEQLTNPLLKVIDVKALATLAHQAGARLVVDNTLATPILERPLELGADLVVHSATKFLGGHADVSAGIVVARPTLLKDLLRRYSKLMGSTLGPFEANLVARGMKTLDLRLRAQCASALTLAHWLESQAAVARVYYPGLATHPQHALATERFAGLYGALVSFDLKSGARESVFRFIDALKLVLPATSLGDVYSLVTAPLLSSHRDLSPEQRAERGIGDGLVRLSVGIEAVEDLRSDLDAALAATI